MRRLMLFAAISLVLPLALAPAVSAAAERVETNGEDRQVAVLDPGTVWISDDGIQHVRGWTATYETTDRLYGEGSLLIVGSWNLNLTTGDGPLWGTMYYEFPDFDGGFMGTWNATFSTFVWSGKSQGRGFGDLEGWQLRQDIRATSPESDAYAGFVFNPGTS